MRLVVELDRAQPVRPAAAAHGDGGQAECGQQGRARVVLADVGQQDAVDATVGREPLVHAAFLVGRRDMQDQAVAAPGEDGLHMRR